MLTIVVHPVLCPRTQALTAPLAVAGGNLLAVGAIKSIRSLFTLPALIGQECFYLVVGLRSAKLLVESHAVSPLALAMAAWALSQA